MAPILVYFVPRKELLNFIEKDHSGYQPLVCLDLTRQIFFVCQIGKGGVK